MARPPASPPPPPLPLQEVLLRALDELVGSSLTAAASAAASGRGLQQPDPAAAAAGQQGEVVAELDASEAIAAWLLPNVARHIKRWVVRPHTSAWHTCCVARGRAFAPPCPSIRSSCAQLPA